MASLEPRLGERRSELDRSPARTRPSSMVPLSPLSTFGPGGPGGPGVDLKDSALLVVLVSIADPRAAC
jgi:hypothetical protein